MAGGVVTAWTWLGDVVGGHSWVVWLVNMAVCDGWT